MKASVQLITLFLCCLPLTASNKEENNYFKVNEGYVRECGVKARELGATAFPEPARYQTNKADEKAVTRKVETTFKASCVSCHYKGSDSGAESFDNILDREQLLHAGVLDLKNPEKSTLYQLVKKGSMPKGKSKLSTQEIENILEWISLGAPGFEADPPNGDFISEADKVFCIANDSNRLPEIDRKFARYLTLTHIYNAGANQAELEEYRGAISKLLNSLSWKKRITRPVTVDPKGTILRFDLRSFEWKDELWRTLSNASPFNIIEYANVPMDEKLKGLMQTSGGFLPFVRGDWFLWASSQPDLYFKILGLPDTRRSLEQLLLVNPSEDIAVRAGFSNSNVSNNNRVIERRDSTYGAYWLSYDFASNAGKKNIFANPLGDFTKGSPGDHEFSPDGGEIIFSLPNGLQGYFIVNAKGARLDKAPIGIVSDPARPDRSVVTGVSCMGCHSKGINAKADQIRTRFEANPPTSFSKEEVATILSLYTPQKELNAFFDEDEKRFVDALVATNNPATEPDRISPKVSLFDARLDLKTAASEIGLTPDEFSSLIRESESLNQVLAGLLAPGGTVARDLFISEFKNILDQVLKKQLPTFSLSVAIGQGSGSVTSNPDGIQCGSSCAKDFPRGTQIALTAVPSAGFAFASWSGDCSGTGSCSVSMVSPRSVIASFVSNDNPTLVVTRIGEGTINYDPPGTSCGTDCTSYPKDTSVKITATPSAGYTFAGWSEECGGTGACIFDMRKSRKVTATFRRTGIFKLRIESISNGTNVTLNPTAPNCPQTHFCFEYAAGTVVTLNHPDPAPPGFVYSWGDDCREAGAGECKLFMDKDHSVLVKFIKVETDKILGKWAVDVDLSSPTSGRRFGAVVEFKDDGSLTHYGSSDGAWKVRGNQVTFSFSTTTSGHYEFVGTLSGDSLIGTVTSNYVTKGAWKGVRYF